MNIFALDESPVLAAQWQHDRHVVKMILESAQMLSTAAHQGVFPVETPGWLYKPTHANHPCNIWLRADMANVAWLTVHLDSLVAEYHRRFGKHHATDTLRWLFNGVVAKHVGVDRFWTRDSERHTIIQPDILAFAAQHTPFAVCMPDEFKCTDAIESYRNLYRRSKIFQSHVKWTRCDMIPDFLFGINDSQTVSDRLEHLVTAHRNQMIHGWTYKTPGPHKPGTPVTPPTPYVKPPTNPNAITRFGRKA